MTAGPFAGNNRRVFPQLGVTLKVTTFVICSACRKQLVSSINAQEIGSYSADQLVGCLKASQSMFYYLPAENVVKNNV